MGLTTPTTLQTSLQQTGYSNILRHLSLTEDIFSVLNENYNVKMKSMPQAIYYRADGLDNNEHSHRLGMLMPLSGTPTYGPGTPLGAAERQRTRSVTIYKNDYSHAVVNQLFGINAQDKKPYNLTEAELQQLGLYFKELKGLHIRQALLQRFSENLTMAAPTSTNCSNQWCANWLIKNLRLSQQPTFSANNTTYTNNIGQALNTAGTGSATVLDFPFLRTLNNYASYTKRIQPLDISVGGIKTSYACILPTSQTQFLKDPTYSTRSMGHVYTSYNRVGEQEQNWPNLLGHYGNMALIEDPRYPTLTVGGTNNPYSLTAGYLYPGNNDRRDSSVGAYDIGFLIGRGALIDWDAESLHYEEEKALTFGKWHERGGFGTTGVQTCFYDDDTNTSPQQFVVIALAFGHQDESA